MPHSPLLLQIVVILGTAVAGKVLGQDLFTMLMVMAIVTTFMTGPLLTLFAGKEGNQDARSADTVARP